jgi:hypothetical protein
MNTIGVVLLAAASATSGVFDNLGKPHVGGKKFLRHHAVMHGAAPPGGMIDGAAMGAGGPGGAGGAALGANEGRRFPNTRSQIFFVDPPGMQIGWQTASGGGERVYLPAQLVAPARYNFTQGYIYRLKITNLGRGREGLSLYPTIEVAPSTPATDAYLTHNPIPVQFTEEDFDQVQAGNFVTKVIYLPDPKYQEVAVSGVETLVSTRLEPGVDPVLEADKRGTILLIVRLGGIDLEMPTSGAANATTGTAVIGGETTSPLGANPAPFVPPAGSTLPSEPLDTGAPVSPATSAPAAPATNPTPTTPDAGTGNPSSPQPPAPGGGGAEPSSVPPGLTAPSLDR